MAKRENANATHTSHMNEAEGQHHKAHTDMLCKANTVEAKAKELAEAPAEKEMHLGALLLDPDRLLRGRGMCIPSPL